MIYDQLIYADKYRGLSPALDRALAALPDFVARYQPAGRLDMDGDRLYANCMRFESSNAPERLWEAHREYIDIHVVVEGHELLQQTSPEGAVPEKPYDAAIEAELFRAAGESSVLLRPGWFAVFFPGEIHRAGTTAAAEPETISKFVVKVAV